MICDSTFFDVIIRLSRLLFVTLKIHLDNDLFHQSKISSWRKVYITCECHIAQTFQFINYSSSGFSFQTFSNWKIGLSNILMVSISTIIAPDRLSFHLPFLYYMLNMCLFYYLWQATAFINVRCIFLRGDTLNSYTKDVRSFVCKKIIGKKATKDWRINSSP